MSIWGDLQYFRRYEFDEPDRMDIELLAKLDNARWLARVPIFITSSYRHLDPGDHGTGEGVDISDNLDGEDISSTWRFQVLHGLFAAGFTRIGIYNKHLHAGISLRLPQKVSWIGKSK